MSTSSDSARYIVGVDLGGTGIKTGVMPEDGSRILAVRTTPTRAELGADGVIARIVEQGEKLVRETGADVIVPGELPLNLLLTGAGVQTIAGASIIDGLATSFKFAEMLVDLRRVSGMKPSRHGFFHAAPERKRFEQVLEFYGMAELGKRIPSA
jgi:hypothetical protein